MSEAIGVSEFSFVESFPKRAEPTAWDQLKAMRKLAKEKDCLLIPTSLVVSILGVSKQRVSFLVKTGVLESFVCGHTVLVTEASLLAYANSERKAGRPVKPGSYTDIARSAVEFGKSFKK